ncbi:hypothetical protein TgHK011_008403 [Trichoderma gracile]|nr:hypothetical protein TgHK011_008403 [Trichoderma gracile]
MSSSMKSGLKFHRQTAAYVATGGTSRRRDTSSSGIEICGGSRSAGESPPQMPTVDSTGSRSMTPRRRRLRIRACRLATMASHLL